MSVTSQVVAAGQDEEYVFCHAKKEKNKGEILFRWDVRCFAAPQFIFRASPTLKKTIWAPHLTKEAAVVIFLIYFFILIYKQRRIQFHWRQYMSCVRCVCVEGS